MPPPQDKLLYFINSLEKFIHDNSLSLPTLIKIALIHVQFEIIHLFLDANGRVGRLLINLLLHSESVLTKPLLYLSLYFKHHHQLYYDLLHEVRFKGERKEALVCLLHRRRKKQRSRSKRPRKM